MNIELEEVVVQDVSDDALGLAAAGAQGCAYTEQRLWTGMVYTHLGTSHLRVAF